MARISHDARRVYRYAAIFGAALAVICHALPPQYRAVCNALAQLCGAKLAQGVGPSAKLTRVTKDLIKAQDLFDEMYKSLADRSSPRLLKRLVSLDLLLIDEMGYLNLRPEQSNIFFKLMEERYGKKSTIITTNLHYDRWYDFLGNKDMVSALLDRLRHRCHTIHIDGATLRTPG